MDKMAKIAIIGDLCLGFRHGDCYMLFTIG